MQRACADCYEHYDDARQSTICPHKNILPPRLMDQKIAAIKLAEAGRRVEIIDGPGSGVPRHIIAIGWSGLITLEGLADDEFRPEQLRLV